MLWVRKIEGKWERDRDDRRREGGRGDKSEQGVMGEED